MAILMIAPTITFKITGKLPMLNVELMPCSLHRSGTVMPAWDRFKIAVIWLSVNFDVFMRNLLAVRLLENSTFGPPYF